MTSYEPYATFYCSLKAFNLRYGSVIVAVWQGPNGYTRQNRIQSSKKGHYYVWFRLEPSGNWIPGRYTLSLLADGVLQKTLEFEVTSSAAQSTPPLLSRSDRGVVAAVTCRKTDSDYRPVDPTSSFGPSDIFYCSVQVRSVRRGQEVVTRWYREKEHLNDITIKLPKSGSGYLSFRLRPGSSTWDAGGYRVDVYIDNTLAKTVNFSVHE